ncbi:MAG: hypothetical protein BWY49_00133 [Candidatus Omnitrophica bacterium ADurb.Bin314]|nr:MAG: hypothetical protein BWY49_00133 [Candidatus Omnitrophica bacterium ADurb.Bin314]
MEHGNRERETLFQAHRKRVGQRIEVRPEPEFLDKLRNPRLRFLFRNMIKERVEYEILPDGEFPIKGKGLSHIAEVFADLHTTRLDGTAEKRRGPFRGRQKPRQHFHGRGFAATVRAEKTEYLAAFDREAHVVHGSETSETTRQALCVDNHFRLSGRARRDRELGVSLAFLFRQQPDKTLFQIFGARPVHQLPGRPGRQHASPVHRHDPVPFLRLIHVGRGNKHAHRGTAFSDIVDERPELTAGERIDTCCRFIQDEEIGIVDQCAAESHFLFHAARKLARGTAGERTEARGL